MKEIGLDELKRIQLNMLNSIDLFCKENGIKYFLTAGTLIGAVRHQGYIPWDDDIDIMMLRSDYEKFLRLFNGKCDNLMVNAPELDWDYYTTYAHIYDIRTVLYENQTSYRGQTIGVKIDLFPFDALPSSEIIYSITRNVILVLNSIIRVKRLTTPFWQLSLKFKLIKVFAGWFPHSLAQKIIHKIAISNVKDTNADVFLRTFDIRKPMRAKKEIFEKAVYVPFEDSFFPIPELADEYLKIRYGDYLTLPPEEERVPHHNFTAYWK